MLGSGAKLYLHHSSSGGFSGGAPKKKAVVMPQVKISGTTNVENLVADFKELVKAQEVLKHYDKRDRLLRNRAINICIVL